MAKTSIFILLTVAVLFWFFLFWRLDFRDRIEVGREHPAEDRDDPVSQDEPLGVQSRTVHHPGRDSQGVQGRNTDIRESWKGL